MCQQNINFNVVYNEHLNNARQHNKIQYVVCMSIEHENQLSCTQIIVLAMEHMLPHRVRVRRMAISGEIIVFRMNWKSNITSICGLRLYAKQTKRRGYSTRKHTHYTNTKHVCAIIKLKWSEKTAIFICSQLMYFHLLLCSGFCSTFDAPFAIPSVWTKWVEKPWENQRNENENVCYMWMCVRVCVVFVIALNVAES